MKEQVELIAVNACRIVLKPIIKLFLKQGISHKAFSDISKSVYVDIALEENPTRRNISDIALRTGISRKEVGKVLDRVEESHIVTTERLVLDSIISNWHVLDGWQDKLGRPVRLPEKSSSGLNLEMLFRTARTDIPFSTVMKYISRSEEIIVDPDGYFVPKARHTLVDDKTDEGLTYLSSEIFGFVETIVNNSAAGRDEALVKRFQRSARVTALSEEEFRVFNLWAGTRLTEMLEEFDNWLVLHGNTEQVSDFQKGVTGVGMYVFSYDHLPYT